MIDFVVALPIRDNEIASEKGAEVSLGWPIEWINEGSGFIRQFGQVGNRSFSTARVQTLNMSANPVEVSSGISVSTAIQVAKRGTLNHLILIGRAASVKRIDELKRPGLGATRNKILHVFGVHLDSSNTLFSTCFTNVANVDSHIEDGSVSTFSRNDFGFSIISSLMASAIAAERQILEKATSALFKQDFFALRSRKHLSHLKNWLQTPTSDSSRVLNEFAELRNSLHLTERSQQVCEAHSQRIRAADFSLAAFLGTLGLFFSDSVLSQTFDLIDTRVEIVVISKITISAIVSAVTWKAMRGR